MEFAPLLALTVALLHAFASALAVGASTVALLLHPHTATRGASAPLEPTAELVATLTRYALAVVLSAGLISLSMYHPGALTLALQNSAFLASWSVMLVLLVREVLVHLGKISAQVSLPLLVGSWYALFLISIWPGMQSFSLLTLLGAYVALVGALGGALFWLTRRAEPEVTLEPSPLP